MKANQNDQLYQEPAKQHPLEVIAHYDHLIRTFGCFDTLIVHAKYLLPTELVKIDFTLYALQKRFEFEQSHISKSTLSSAATRNFFTALPSRS